MATVPSFMDWSRRRSENLMDTAEDLLEKLEDVSDLLTEIEDKYIKTDFEKEDDAERDSILRQFRDGLDSARNLVGVLKREKWRLSKREMSVELRMGELEDYKTHLKTDMSSLNETVDALSVRVVQLENQLCEAQDTREEMDAELRETVFKLEKSEQEKKELYRSHKSIDDELRALKKQWAVGTVRRENDQLQFELTVLQDENSKLKDMIRDAESKITPTPGESHSALTFGNSTVTSGDSTVTSGDSTVTSGDSTVTSGEASTTPVPPQRHKAKVVENGNTPEVYL